MDQFLSELCQRDLKLCLLKKICHENSINAKILNGFGPKKIKDIYSRLIRHYNDHPQIANTQWFQSELKLFHWILICYSLIHQKKIEIFNSQQWSLLQQIFYPKDILVFKYEAKKLLQENGLKSKPWNQKEQEILYAIMKQQQNINEWKKIGLRFFELSEQKFFRTGKQCREHWFNHLDPSKNHGKWTSQEQFAVFKYVLTHGKKWSVISKTLVTNRTEHMIKNRYNSIIRKWEKLLGTSNRNEKSLAKIIVQFYSEKQNFSGETVDLKNFIQRIKSTLKPEEKNKEMDFPSEREIISEESQLSQRQIGKIQSEQISNPIKPVYVITVDNLDDIGFKPPASAFTYVQPMYQTIYYPQNFFYLPVQNYSYLTGNEQ